MSQLDDFMSQIIDFSEKEKEETILFFATALSCGDPMVIKKVSRKVMLTVMPFLMNIMLDGLKKE